MLYINPFTERYAQFTAPVVGSEARATKAFEEMEHLFLNELLKVMRKSIFKGGLFERSSITDQYEALLDDALSHHMAESGQMGIAKIMEAEFRARELQRTYSRESLGQASTNLIDETA